MERWLIVGHDWRMMFISTLWTWWRLMTWTARGAICRTWGLCPQDTWGRAGRRRLENAVRTARAGGTCCSRAGRQAIAGCRCRFAPQSRALAARGGRRTMSRAAGSGSGVCWTGSSSARLWATEEASRSAVCTGWAVWMRTAVQWKELCKENTWGFPPASGGGGAPAPQIFEK